MSEKGRIARLRRHRRVRAKISGTPERPRLNVFRSLTGIYAQVIDDVAGHTLVSASTIDRELRGQVDDKTRPRLQSWWARCWPAGHRLQESSRLSFDRGGYRYHGRVKALAEGAREAGLEF